MNNTNTIEGDVKDIAKLTRAETAIWVACMTVPGILSAAVFAAKLFG